MSKLKELKIKLVMRAERVNRARALEIISERTRYSKVAKTSKQRSCEPPLEIGSCDNDSVISAADFFGVPDDDFEDISL